MNGERLLKIAGKFSRFGKKVSSKVRSGAHSASDEFDPFDITKAEGMIMGGLLLSPTAMTGKNKKKSQGKHIAVSKVAASRWGVPDLDEDKDELTRAVAPVLGAGQGLLWANLLAKKRTPKLFVGSAVVGAASFSLMDTLARKVRQSRREK